MIPLLTISPPHMGIIKPPIRGYIYILEYVQYIYIFEYIQYINILLKSTETLVVSYAKSLLQLSINNSLHEIYNGLYSALRRNLWIP